MNAEVAVEPVHVPVGLRDAATSAWRALVAALIHLDALGIRTPCDEDPAAFLGEDVELRRQAAKSCGLCPIRRQCGAFAEANRETVGVWAGKDRTWGAAAELERRKQRAEPPASGAGTGEDEHAFTTVTGKDER